jgi:hypothetical protein
MADIEDCYLIAGYDLPECFHLAAPRAKHQVTVGGIDHTLKSTPALSLGSCGETGAAQEPAWVLNESEIHSGARAAKDREFLPRLIHELIRSENRLRTMSIDS